MKNIKFFGLASTLILASATGFTSCSSDSADPIGGTGVAGQVVKTQFAINIPYGGNGSSSNLSHKSTRMTEAMTQQDNSNFRGISDIVLLTFSGDPSTAEITEATSIINIGTDGNAYDQDNYRKLYRDIEIPVGTSYMAFYGRASKNSGTYFETGKITDVGTKTSEKTLANISHKLTAISNTADFTTDDDAKAIITALNAIANVEVEDGGTKYTWATIGDQSTLPSWLTAQEKEFLKKRYNAFIQLKAGSKTSVEAFIKNLKSALAGETDATIPEDKKLAKEIVNKCDAALESIKNINFPGKFNLPDGAATLSWNSGNTFVYSAPGSAHFITNNAIDYQKICYPAELSYFVNTKTMVSNLDMSKVSDFPTYEDWTKNTGADWSTKTNFKEDAVTNSTKTVGLKDPVQYSVAVLKSTIKCNAATLKDNGLSKGGLEADQDVPVKDTGFPVTGILIGGQPESVDWKYEPTSTETFANTIYDQSMNGTITAGTSTSTPNYTLVFDNKNTEKKTVFVTIELENNSGMDFYGQDGIILKGAKFYLVGKLDPTNKTEPAGVDHVFVKDHITTANFNITNLKSAYNCIPDLRTSGINVGLAVDLSWQTGITFDVEI